MKDMDNFIKGVQYLAKSESEKTLRDVTYKGIVTKVNSNNTYTVKINGKDYINTEALSDVVLSLNSIVRVVFPQNNSELRYILNSGDNIAREDASNALSAANLAKNSAVIALNTANTAQSAANTAQSTANEASNKANAVYDNTGGMKFITGKNFIPFGSNPGSVYVGFGTTFTSMPIVVTSNVFNDNPILVKTSDVSTSGFTARVAGGFTTSGTRDFLWLAVGT